MCWLILKRGIIMASEMDVWGRRSICSSVLLPHTACVLDCGSEVFVWTGRADEPQWNGLPEVMCAEQLQQDLNAVQQGYGQVAVHEYGMPELDASQPCGHGDADCVSGCSTEGSTD